MDQQSKQFDTLRAGDELNVLGLRAVITEVVGHCSRPDLWKIFISFNVDAIHNDSELIFPAGRWVDCYSTTIARQIEPTKPELHPARKYKMQYPTYIRNGVTVREI